MAHDVLFSPEAEEDLLELYDGLATRASPDIALRYAEQLRTYCLSFATFSERGTRRDDLRPGLRITGFRKRVTIAFHMVGDRVMIDRLFYGGRDVKVLLGEDAVD